LSRTTGLELNTFFLKDGAYLYSYLNESNLYLHVVMSIFNCGRLLLKRVLYQKS